MVKDCMVKSIFILIAIMPFMNFLHEGGHWLGGKIIGANPRMLLQRVDMGDESNFSSRDITVFNWGGPFINYLVIGSAFVYTPLLPVGILMACHRLGPNVFASALYLSGNRRFTTDETKQVSVENRLAVALLFSILYFAFAVFLARRWELNPISSLSLLALLTIIYFCYGFLLDQADGILASH